MFIVLGFDLPRGMPGLPEMVDAFMPDEEDDDSDDGFQKEEVSKKECGTPIRCEFPNCDYNTSHPGHFHRHNLKHGEGFAKENRKKLDSNKKRRRHLELPEVESSRRSDPKDVNSNKV